MKRYKHEEEEDKDVLRQTEPVLGIVVGMLGSNSYLAKAAGTKDQRRKGKNSRTREIPFVFLEIAVKHRCHKIVMAIVMKGAEVAQIFAVCVIMRQTFLGG